MGGQGGSRLQKVGRRAEGTTSRSGDEGKVYLPVLPVCTLFALVHVLSLSPLDGPTEEALWEDFYRAGLRKVEGHVLGPQQILGQ